MDYRNKVKKNIPDNLPVSNLLCKAGLTSLDIPSRAFLLSDAWHWSVGRESSHTSVVELHPTDALSNWDDG